MHAIKDTPFDKNYGVPKVRANPYQNTLNPNYYYTEVGPINHKDPAPYYDPIQNPDNMWKKVQPNIFNTPIQYKEELFPGNAAEIEYRRRLIPKPGYYYDPSHRLERDSGNHLADAIADDATRRAERQPTQYDQWKKEEEAEDWKWK